MEPIDSILRNLVTNDLNDEEKVKLIADTGLSLARDALDSVRDAMQNAAVDWNELGPTIVTMMQSGQLPHECEVPFGPSHKGKGGKHRAKADDKQQASDDACGKKSEPTPADDVIGKLERLAAMRAAGDLDDDEYHVAKARLLERL